MTRYYFDIRHKNGWHVDYFGVELVDFAEAREQAIALLPDIVREDLPEGDFHEVLCQVRDDISGIVYEGELVFNGRSIKRERR